MIEKKITVKTAEEINNMSILNTRFDVALKARMDSIDKTIKELTAELEAVKKIAKKRFGENGGNDVFSTETRISYVMNTAELEILIGKENVEKLKNKEKKSTYVHW